MGFINNVVPGAPIASTWGNAIRDRTVLQFASAAERAAQWASPPVGAVSYLTDTGALEAWYGASVGWRKPWAQPWGMIGYAQIVADQGPFAAAGADVNGLAVTVTVIANRRVRVSAQVALVANGGGNVGTSVIIKDTNGNVGQANGSIPSAGYWNTQTVTRIYTPPAGAIAYKVNVSGQVTGGVNIGAGPAYPSFLIVEDIGPNGVPA